MKEDQETAEGHRIQKEARNMPLKWQRTTTGEQEITEGTETTLTPRRTIGPKTTTRKSKWPK